jgi:hypothetical protein
VQLAPIGPLAVVAGLKRLVVIHAVAGGKGNVLLGLADTAARHQRSGQGLVRCGRPGQQLVVVRHIQFELQVSVADFGGYLAAWPSTLRESQVEVNHRIGVPIYL